MFANTLALCRLILRRDRLIMLLWLIGAVVLVVGFASVVEGMYPTVAERSIAAYAMQNPAMSAMLGPVNVIDINNVTIGELYALYMALWTAIIIAIMNIFHIVRHTRTDEEKERIDILRAAPVGRLSSLGAALVSAAGLDALIALVMGIGLGLLGIETMGWNGSLLMGATMGMTGMVFAVVTAILCQLTSNPRVAQGLAFAVLSLAYVLRAVGDLQGIAPLNDLSIFGLALRTEIYSRNLWWPIAALLAVCLVGSAVALWLCSIRDLGAGLIAQRPGRRHAREWLRNPEALAWRLLSLAFVIWMLSLVLLGSSYGTVMGDMEGFVESNEIFRELFTGDPVQFISYIMIIITVIGTIPIMQFILKARSQESEGFAENVLVRAVSRTAQLRGYFAIAFAAAFIMPFLNAVGLWAGSAAVLSTPIAFSTILKASMAYVPAVLFMLGVAMVLIGFLPKLAKWAWAYLGYAFVVLYFGALMQLPDWLGRLSPFDYVPQLPIDEFKPLPIVIMVTLSLVMFIAGFIGYRRRDMVFTD